MSIHRTPFLCIFIVLGLCASLATASTSQFQSFEAEYESVFLAIVAVNCSNEYAAYLARNDSTVVYNHWIGQNLKNRFIQPLLDCILEHTSETIKSTMASAQVMLGLTPTILAILGPSTEETSTLFVIGRRPLLAFFISMGTPAVYPARAFDYQNPLETLLNERQGRLRIPRHWIGGGLISDVLITVAEYLIVIAAVANMIQLGVELGHRTVFACAPEVIYLPLLWGVLGLNIHLFGAMALWLRARVSGGKKSCNPVLNWVKIHFTPLIKLRPLYVQLERETLPYIALMWFASVFTVCHIVFGTLIFSSMMFVSVRDAVYVIGRLMSSTICCRIVLMYELAALRDSFNVGDAIAGGLPTDEMEPMTDRHGVPHLRPPRPVRIGTWESDRSASSSNILILK